MRQENILHSDPAEMEWTDDFVTKLAIHDFMN